MTNVFYQPHVSRKKGLFRANTILERFGHYTGDYTYTKIPTNTRDNNDEHPGILLEGVPKPCNHDNSTFNRELVLETIRRLTQVEPGMPEPLFQHASYSSVWRSNRGEFKGLTKRQQTLVLQFQTSHGRHPVELVLRIEKNNV